MTDEELKTEYGEVLERMRQNRIRHDDARSRRIVDAVSQRLLSLVPAVGSIRLVSTPEAMSLVNATTMADIQAKTGPVALVCKWYRKTPVPFHDFPWIVEVMRSYSEPVDWSPDACVVFEPVVRERSVVRALLLGAVDDHPGVPLHLVTFSADRKEIETACGEVEDMVHDITPGPVTVHGFVDLGPSDPRWLSSILSGPMSTMGAGERMPGIVQDAMAPALRRIYRIDENVVAA